MPKSQFVYILGPTGVGKTDLSYKLAESFNWPIINCDSVQVYRDVNIGTAKPTPEEMKKCPHYLFDYVEPPKSLTAADYISDVSKVIKNNQISNALFVGGSGFYIQALEKGLYPNSKPNEEVKKEIESWIETDGYPALYKWLIEKDPEFAKKISENDHYRIRRAVEVMKSQNKSMTDLKKEFSEKSFSPLPENRSLKLGLRMEKEKLRTRIEARTEKMLKAGFVDEVRVLREKGLQNWPPMQSVGYKEIQLYLNGELPEAELFERIVISTMQLIKKQMTWFKRDPEIQWFEPDQISEAVDFVLKWYEG